jgi:glycosyltransferase involved in cell wall biosynthesis
MDPMPLLHGYSPNYKTIMGLRNEFLYKDFTGGAISLYKNGVPGRCTSIKDKCCILHMVNKNQMSVFKNIVVDKPLVLAQHGIDEEIFDRNKYNKVNNESMVVGISGRGSSNKGFELVVEACKQAGVKCLGAQYGRNRLSKNDMPKFYSSIDVFSCMSKTEGLCNPILEAGAMGIPCISTRSGAAEEMIVDGVSGLLIDRNVESLVGALNKMKDKKLRCDMGTIFYEEIMEKWTWKVKIEDFRKMFKMFFEGN